MKFDFDCMGGEPLKMSEAREESATRDSVRLWSHGLLADNQSFIMAIVLVKDRR